MVEICKASIENLLWKQYYDLTLATSQITVSVLTPNRLGLQIEEAI